jgi:hypothetical protein
MIPKAKTIPERTSPHLMSKTPEEVEDGVEWLAFAEI